MSSRRWTLFALAMLVTVALILRTNDLAALRPSPDEGNYQHSARLDVIGRAGDPGAGLGLWIRQDARWVRELYADYFRAEGKSTYPHSYIEQWVARQVYRAGAKRLAAVRINSALLGTLLVIALYTCARGMRLDRGSALAAAALAALDPLMVWYSRTGWGQMGCTFFFVVYLTLAFRLFDPQRQHTRRAYVGLGVALAATTVLAYGYHEMIVVHVAWMGLCACFAATSWWCAPERAERGYLARLFTSPRTWTYALSSLPAALLLASLAFLNPWAQDIWLDAAREASFGERLRLSAIWVFQRTRVQEQITWAVLLFALVGAVVLWRRNRHAFAFCALNAVGGVVIYVFFYSNPSLVRIYLPTITILLLFAGVGVAAPGAWMRGLAARLAYGSVVGLLVLYLLATSVVTLFGPMQHVLSVRQFYWADGVELREARHEMTPIFELLRAELAEGERVGVYAIHEPLHRCLDEGLGARYFDFSEDRARWPRFLIGRRKQVEGYQNAHYGEAHPYVFRVEESAGRIGLYELR